MNTKKKQLTETPEQYTNENGHTLDLFYSERFKLFFVEFNAEVFTFKSWNGCVAKRNYFINKYNLKSVES